MKNIIKVMTKLMLSLILGCVSIAHTQDFPTLVVPDSELRSKYNWDLCGPRITSAFGKRVGVPEVPALYIKLNPNKNDQAYYASGNNTILVPWSALDVPIPTDADQGDCGIGSSVSHELGHLTTLLPLEGIKNVLAEGYADAASNVTYDEMADQGYKVIRETGVLSARTFVNLPRDVMAGKKGYGDRTVSGWLEILTKGDLHALTKAIRGQFSQADRSDYAYLRAIDQALPKFEGKLPSTIIMSLAQTFDTKKGFDGYWFAAYPMSDIKDQFGSLVYPDHPPIIRQGSLLGWRVNTRVNGIDAPQYNEGEVLLQVLDTSGQVVMEATPYPSNHLLEFPATPPPGAYIVKTHKCPGTPCTTGNAEFTHALPWFALDDPLWYHDGFVLIANGDGQGDGFDQLGKVKLHVVNPDPKISWTELPGGLCYFRLNGYRGDLTVADNSGKTYTYQLYTNMTQVAFWTQLSQPYLYAITDAVNWKPQMTPGSWAVAWTWGASHDDPIGAPSIPLPFSLSGARIRVTDSDGKVYDAALNYVSQTQINFQVPRELRQGTAKVAVILNKAVSNEAEVEVVPENPSVFPVGTASDGKLEGVITGIFGQQAGKLVGTMENPVGKTDWVSIWANGLGAVQPQPENAKAPSVAVRVVNPVTVRIGSSVCVTDFAGLAPGVVSLGQINVNLATCTGLSGGRWPLVISVAGVDSDPVWVSVQ